VCNVEAILCNYIIEIYSLKEFNGGFLERPAPFIQIVKVFGNIVNK
jgi:hypothetical protein